MPLDTQSYTGERLSFVQLIEGKDLGIEIPILQRDFAQGRDTAGEIRHQFIDALHNYLLDSKPIDLDFVYGSIEPLGNINRFIPLDGQQRLTTLFLLHWYLALKENKIAEFRAIMFKNGKSQFSYETRISSREFCNYLVKSDVDMPSDESEKISEKLKDCSWFFRAWKSDPTISSMLVMLDAIHDRFCNAPPLFHKLLDPSNPHITFQFIELKKFKLTDSLYIKMNARGKALTDFENFKAKLEQLLEKYDDELETNFKHDVSWKIDTSWTDLFWNYKDKQTKLFDKQFMNFMRVILTTVTCVEKNRTEFLKKHKDINW